MSISPPRSSLDCTATSLDVMEVMQGRPPSQGRHRQRHRPMHATGKRNNTPEDRTGGSWSGSRHRRSQGGRLIEPSCELEVLKCIMLRESYLERVARLSEDMARRAKRSRGRLRDLPPGMVDLLDLLRVATLDVVEAVSLWRLSQAVPTAAAFEWNGHNYLIKMLHDCDFLDRVESLRRWLGFGTSRNPFFVPPSSQTDSSDDSAADLDGYQPLVRARLDRTGLADVGRPSSLGPFEVPSAMEHGVDEGTKGQTRNKNARKAQSATNPSPYAAAVVNDPRLLPPTKVKPLSRGGGVTSVESAALKAGGPGGVLTGVMVSVDGLASNIVSREDMQRVGVARQVLIEEEMRVVAATAAAAAAGVVATEGESLLPTTRSPDSPTLRKGSRSILPPTSKYSRRRESEFRAGGTLASIQNTRGKVPCNVASNLSAGNAPNTPEPASSSGDIGFLSRSAAGLLQQPPPEPHPGLGPVLLQSDLPGGELYRNPFVHTVKTSPGDERVKHSSSMNDRVTSSSIDNRAKNPSTDERVPCTADLATSASDGAFNAVRGRCSTAPEVPAAPVVSDDFAAPLETCDFSLRFPADRDQTNRHRRAATAPSTVSVKSVPRAPTGTAGESLHSGQACQRSGSSKGSARLSAIRARRNLSRKAGAELRALTAAGTTGRRQPPPREARLRRLARDVERHSSELRSLAREEERLGKNLAREHGRSREEQLLSGDRQEGVHTAQPNADVRSTLSSLDGEGLDCLDLGQGAEGELGSKDVAGDSHTNDWGTQGGKMFGQASSASTGNGAESLKIEVKLGKQQHDHQIEGGDSTSVTQTGSRVDVVEALLKEKRQEIALKSFHLGVKRDELRCLLMVQKHELKRKRDVDLERMRIRLQEGQSLPQDEATAETLEDGSCLLVQKRFRGNVDRKYAAWYKSHIHQGATTIQRGVRYIWDKRATARRLRLEALVTLIQAAIRMFVARQRYTRRLSERERASASFKVQTVCRGMKGRKRAAARRAMKHAAGKALEWVSLETLQPRHLKELARAIHGALVDPVRQFPPAGVLGAIRVALTILEDATDTENGAENGSENGPGRNMDTVTFQTALGRTLRGAVCAPDLAWEMAARVLGRPFRLLRRMRAFASGLGASSDKTPVRLLHLSPKAVELFRAYRDDPSWSKEALLAIEEGGAAAASFVGWARELERVYREQPRLRDFLRDAQPAWLRKSRALQKRRRASELRAEACRFAVAVARQYHNVLEARGKAYGDPLAALEVLEAQCGAAEAVVLVLEGRRKGLRAVQEKAEEAEGLKLRQGMEFAEREAAVAARAEKMAKRLGNCGPEELATLARKVIEWGVISRELSRRFSVWKRRCREEYLPLLDEWVPPTKSQTVMAQTLGTARAWEQITTAQKGRLVDEAGGRRFVKGLTGRCMEIWRSVSEGLMSCREDIESGEARLAEDVESFEQRISSANEDAAAKKVSLASWDNATEATKVLEMEEDADAARDERNTAMGAIIPRGLLDNTTRPSPNGPSRRPTLVLLGLDLPAAVRDEIRTDLDRDAPDIFGLHLSGADTLPSLAAAVRTRDRGFLDPCRDSRAELPPRPQTTTRTQGKGQEYLTASAETPGDGGGGHTKDPGDGEKPHNQTGVRDTRTGRLQATLSAGRNASLEVVPGPGLWARGRFLRDLEALLLGLDDDSSSRSDRSGDASRQRGVTVVLIEGDHRNRSGGGADIKYGTKFATTAITANLLRENDWTAASPARHGLDRGLPLAGVTARRTKNRLEEAAQCLHDLSATHGDTPSPFVAISAKNGNFSHTASAAPTSDAQCQGLDCSGPAHVLGSLDGGEGAQNERIKSSKAACSSPGLELLLAACHMITHPDRQYDLRESRGVDGSCDRNSPQNTSNLRREECPASDTLARENAALTVASCLAGECRQDLAEMQSARGVADVLREVDLTSVPFETAVSLRLLLQHPAWPATSPRSNAGGCFASEAFCGWVVAAVAAATEIALTWGGSAHCSDSDSNRKHGGAIHNIETEPRSAEQDPGGGEGSVGLNSPTRGGECRNFPTLQDARCERDLERELLQELETSMVDEIITIVDDGLALPQLLRRGGGAETPKGGPPRRQCRASEAFIELMETVLRPFQVFAGEHPIRVVGGDHQAADKASPLSTTDQQGAPPRDNIFRVFVSRVFGSIYVRARPLGAQRDTRRAAVMARLKDEDLIPLVSPNWMETHELSALRELRNEAAVWRAVVDTLSLHYPSNKRQTFSVETHHKIDPPATPAPVCVGEHIGLASAAATSSEVVSAHAFTMDPPTFSGGVLSFCHPRRLTLESSCLVMGQTVPIKVFEECRSDFWCEAQLPPSLALLGSNVCPVVGMRIPKEFIQLLLDDNHPMRMQTMLDAFDLRELSTLIADRLKVCRIGSTRRGARSYRYWLDGAMGEDGDQSETMDSTPAAGVAKNDKQEGGATTGEFRLSLRKRGVGQVIFSRLVSFWVPGDPPRRLSEEVGNAHSGDGSNLYCGEGGNACSGEGSNGYGVEGSNDYSGGEGSNNYSGGTRDDIVGTCEPSGPNEARIIQVLVSVKVISHRGERGELRGETHDPNLGGRPGRLILPPELTRSLLEGSNMKTIKGETQRKQTAQYWRDALTWRLRVSADGPVPETAIDMSGDRVCDENAAGDTNPASFSRGEGNSSPRISVDERKPLFSLDLVSARCETSLVGLKSGEGKPPTAGKTMFDILLLPPQETSKPPEKSCNTPEIELELVATHRQTMAVFRFSVPAEAFVDEFSGIVVASLATPTALRAELNLPASATLRNIAGTWMHYVPADRGEGRRATLTFSFPGLTPVTSEPYVGLRGEGYERGGFGQNPEAKRDGGAAQWRRRSSTHVRENVGAAAAGTSRRERPRNARGSACGSGVTTPRVEANTKNERMVLRRSTAVPQLAELERRPEDYPAGRTDGRGTEEEETAAGPASKVLVLSVFEVFSTGPESRVVRHLKICARDETVRPAVETATVISWVGTCEGVEGGALWRVITQCLGFRCIRDKGGKNVGIRLEVLPQRDTESPDRGCVVPSDPNKPETCSLTPAEVDAPIASATGGGEDGGPVVDSSREHGAHEMSPDSGKDNAAPVTPLDTPQANVERGTSQNNERDTVLRTKIYDGWHRITGIRLHVQCLQEEGSATVEVDGTAYTGNVDAHEKPWRPAGRGGTISLPRASILRFRLSDPRTGRTSEVQLSVEDALRNLSTGGGIVEAGLLDAGRRPALAKSIAQHLQLVFNASGGYRVTLPLPAEWNRTASLENGLASC